VLHGKLEENGYDIRPSPWLRNRHEAKFTVEEVQIALRRDDEDVIWLQDHSFRDQPHWHLGIRRKNFMQLCGYEPKMINDDDRYAHVEAGAEEAGYKHRDLLPNRRHRQRETRSKNYQRS
jgi:hypothetical protein